MDSAGIALTTVLSGLIACQARPDFDKGATVLIGLIGRGIQASRTPAMHEREGARLGLNCVYVLVDFDRLHVSDSNLGAAIAAAEDLGFAGLNVTHPFKQRVIDHLTVLSPEAAAIGAVNTIVFEDGRRVGHNTDSWGFAESFRDGMKGCALERVIQFGAGGAGAAVAYAMLELGADDLAIVDVDIGRARDLARRMTAKFNRQVHSEAVSDRLLGSAVGIVNATPVGMTKYPGVPFPPHLLSARHWVAEIVYFPERTELLELAKTLGCRTLSGTGMAVCQAVLAFELFTGRSADRSAMANHFAAAA